MKTWVLAIVGVVLLAIGLVWALQGIGIMTGSGMTGQKLWLGIGIVVGVAGIALLIRSVRRIRLGGR